MSSNCRQTQNYDQYYSLLYGIIAVVLLLGIPLARKIFRRHPDQVKVARELPGPKGIPVIGNGLELLRLRGDVNDVCKVNYLRITNSLKQIIFTCKLSKQIIFVLGDIFGVNYLSKQLMEIVGISSLIAKYSQEFGSLYKLWFGNVLMVVLSNPKDLEKLFFSNKTICRPPNLANFYDWESITTNRKWKEQRKAQLPFYANTRIFSLVSPTNDYIRKFLSEFHALVGKPEIDICDVLYCWSFNHHLSKEKRLDIICPFWVHLNIDAEFSISEVKNYLKYPARPYDDISTAFHRISRILRVVYKILGKTYESEDDRLLKLSEKLTKTNVPDVEKELHRVKECSNVATSSSLFLAAIDKCGKENGLDRCLLHNVKDILKTFASNVAQILASFLFVVAAHPDVQNKLHEELDEKFANDNRPADADDIIGLPYLHQVFMETMRWHTISAITLRNVDETLQIVRMDEKWNILYKLLRFEFAIEQQAKSRGSYLFPPNTGLVIDFYSLHRNPEYYPNPAIFDPDRFLPEAVDARPKCSFLPFGEGPRGCIGTPTTLKLVLTKGRLHTAKIFYESFHAWHACLFIAATVFVFSYLLIISVVCFFFRWFFLIVSSLN